MPNEMRSYLIVAYNFLSHDIYSPSISDQTVCKLQRYNRP